MPKRGLGRGIDIFAPPQGSQPSETQTILELQSKNKVLYSEVTGLKKQVIELQDNNKFLLKELKHNKAGYDSLFRRFVGK